ncbi:MAG: hypothetical protein ABR500_09025 [Dermatophilaceae bacterium]|nr:hypothetical protein [Intrasporangiaceae bacterium]
MTARTRRFDRFLVGLLGLVLLTGAALIIAWLLRWLEPGDEIETDPVLALSEQVWWPYALAALGVVLVLLGARWLLAQAPQSIATEVRLPGSGHGGRFTAALGPVLQTAEESLERHPFIAKVSTSKQDRDERVGIVLDVTMRADAPLKETVDVIDGHLDEVHRVIGRSDFDYLARISVDDSPQPGRRVW